MAKAIYSYTNSSAPNSKLTNDARFHFRNSSTPRRGRGESRYLPLKICPESVLVATPHNLSLNCRGQAKINILGFILRTKDLANTVAPPYTRRRSTKCHLSRHRSSNLLHRNPPNLIEYCHCQSTGSRASLRSSLPLQRFASLNMTSSSKVDQSTSGLYIKRCCCGMALIQYVLE